MSDDDFDTDWIAHFATQLGIAAPDPQQIDALLDLAGRAAHGSGDRRNAPIACYLAGLSLGAAGREPSAEVIRAM